MRKLRFSPQLDRPPYTNMRREELRFRLAPHLPALISHSFQALVNCLQEDGKVTVVVVNCGGGRGQELHKHDSLADLQDMLFHRPGAGNADGSADATTASKVLFPAVANPVRRA